jgi:hypothetical protein
LLSTLRQGVSAAILLVNAFFCCFHGVFEKSLDAKEQHFLPPIRISVILREALPNSKTGRNTPIMRAVPPLVLHQFGLPNSLETVGLHEEITAKERETTVSTG